MDKIIHVENLYKKFGEIQAVNGITFFVERGQLFSLLGPNGAGKSTTINILCTLLTYDGGSVIMDNFQLGKDDEQIKSRIGVVFQDSVLDPLLTVRENLTVRGKFYIKNSVSVKQAVHEAALAVDAMEFIDRPYGKLSGGQRRRVDISRALIHKPDILFLDEPTTGLDPQARKMVWETIKHLQQERGMTVFLTTHYMEEANLSDYIVMLNHGSIAEKGKPDELKNRYQVHTLDEVFLRVSERNGEL